MLRTVFGIRGGPGSTVARYGIDRTVFLQPLRYKRQRVHHLMEDVVTFLIGIRISSGLVVILQGCRHVELYVQVVVRRQVHVRTEVAARILMPLDDAFLVAETAADEVTGLLATAAHRKIVLVHERQTAHRRHPVRILITVRRIAVVGHGDLLGGELVIGHVVAAQLVEGKTGIIVLHVLRAVHEIGHGRHLRERYVAAVVDRHGALMTALGRDKDDAGGSLHSIDGACRSILENRYGLHVVRIDRTHLTLDSVHQHQRARAVVGGIAAHEHRYAVGSGSAGRLLRNQSRELSDQGLRNGADGRFLDFIVGNRRNGSGQMHLLLRTVTDHHDLVHTGRILLHHDIDFRTAVYRQLLAFHTQVRENQHISPGRGIQTIRSVARGHRAHGGPLDDHIDTHERIPLSVGNGSRNVRLCESG